MSQELFVACGYGGIRTTSSDGKNWSTPELGKEGEIYRIVAFGGGACIAGGSFGGDNLIAPTHDGKTWKPIRKDAGYSRYLRGMTFAFGKFYGFVGDGTTVGAGQPSQIHSADGETWSEPASIGGSYLIRRAAFGNGIIVGVGDRGRRATSHDGISWKDMPDSKPIDTLVDIAFGNGSFVGTGLNGLRVRTADGLVWTDKQLGEEGEHLNSVLWTGSQFVAVGAGGTYFSPDGAKWRRVTNSNAPITSTYGKGLFVGAKWKGRLLYSANAVEWTETIKLPSHIEAVGFGAVG